MSTSLSLVFSSSNISSQQIQPPRLAPYKPELDTTRADWVVNACSGPLWTLHRTVPAGYERYLCIQHHGFRWSDDCLDPETTALDLDAQNERMWPVKWSEIAEEFGKDPSTSRTWHDIAPSLAISEPQPGGIAPPLEGELPLYVLDTVFDRLGHHSGADQECICAIWEGFANQEIRQLERSGAASIEGMAQQAHLLMRAPLHVVWEQWRSVIIHSQATLGLVPQAVWPTTREWFFAVPFEMQSSFLGGPAHLLSLVEASKSIDAYRALNTGSYL
ncbi:MAG: hypothetical protein AAGI72_20980 [Pseudomonadota bacterium]